MTTKLKLTAIAVITMVFHLTAIAQNGDTLEIQKSKYNTIKLVRFKADKTGKRKMQDAQLFLRNVLKTRADDELLPVKTFTDDLGITHKIFKQYFKGIPVEGAAYKVHGKNGDIEMVNGEFIPVSLNTVKPTFSEEAALKKALYFVNAKKYKWEDAALQQFKKQIDKNPNASYYPKGELVISRDVLKTGNAWNLSFKFTISALEPESEQLVFVDAITGDILNRVSLICDINTPGTAQTRYSGTQNITGDSFTGGFRLRENRNGVEIQTLNMRNGTNYSNAADFVDNDNNWTAIEHANANRDQVALDAHWAAERVLDYWRTVHNRNSIDGNGIRVISYVHYRSNWDNAQWDATTHAMRYGDGLFFTPLTSIDICAHEFGHGIDQYESNLTYQNLSGALDEGFADIWGAVIENWVDPTKQHWLIGEEIGGPLRSMANPNLFGQPDTYNGINWINVNGCTPSDTNDFCGVHTNSGVLNYCFFLLSDGGSGTNDIGNAFNVTGIGINNAARIAYRAQSIYLHSSPDATFYDARNAFINAAWDLYGENSCEYISTVNAWFAVGLGSAYTGNGGYSISGPNNFGGYADYEIQNLPAGATVIWSATPVGVVTLAPNGNKVRATQVNPGGITLNATITTPCNIPPISKSNISVGVPQVFGAHLNEKMCDQVVLTPVLASGSMADSYKWEFYFLDGSTITENTSQVKFTIYNWENVSEFRLSAHNTLGWSDPVSDIVSYTPCAYALLSLAVSPNPATSILTVEATETPQEDVEIQLVDLYTGNQAYAKKLTKGSKKTQLSVGHLKRGQYVLTVKDKNGKIVERKQVVLQ